MPRSLLVAGLVALASVTVSAADDIGTGRYADYTRAAAAGPLMPVLWAGHLGGAGYENAVGAVLLPGEVLVVAGNHQGGPTAKSAIVFGAPGEAPAPPADAKAAGNVANQAGTLTVGKVAAFGSAVTWRFGYGVASLSAIAVQGDLIVVGGRCGPSFGSLKTASVAWQELPAGEQAKESASASFLAGVTATGALRWVVAAHGTGGAPDEIFTDRNGNAYADLGALVRVGSAGKATVVVAKSGRPNGSQPREGWRSVAPDGRTFFYGGDRNTRTNKEPYRQPFLYTYDEKGARTAVWYEPDPKAIGSDADHLESDSAISDLIVRPDGTWILAGWSDGGNSVLAWQPTNWKKETATAMGWSPWGAGVLGSGHIWTIDPVKKSTVKHLWWLAFLPSNFVDPKNPKKTGGNRPNTASTDRLALLDDGAVAVMGSAATGLIQTPNALYRYPNDGSKFGGDYVTVLAPDLEKIRFSSYLPGVKVSSIVAAGSTLVVTGTSRGSSGSQEKPVVTPVAGGGKPFIGGTDGWVMILRKPSLTPAPSAGSASAAVPAPAAGSASAASPSGE
jgi:hypothetical protein